MSLKKVGYIKLDDLKGELFAAGKQSLLIPVDFIKTIYRVFENLTDKKGATILIYKIGESLGRSYVQSLEYILREEGEQFSHETMMKSACNAIFMESGWGSVKFCSLDMEKNEAEIRVVNTPSIRFFKESTLDLERGVFAGVYQEVTGREAYCFYEGKKDGEVAVRMTGEIPGHIKDEETMTLLSRRELQRKIQDATDEIAHEKEKITALVESLVDGLFLLDVNAKVMMVNPQAQRYFNIRAADVIGKKITDIGLCHCLFDLFSNVKESYELGMQDSSEMFCMPLKDRELFVSITGKPVTGRDQAIIGYMIIAHDITREKVLDRLKNEFLSIAAHQLRTPLSGIKWSLQMIINGEMGQVPGEVQEYLQKAYDTNERMITLVNDLLDVTRIEEGRFIYDFGYISLRDMVRRNIDQVRMVADVGGVNIRLEGEDAINEPLKADEEKLKLAFQNIMENAVKYSKRGGEIIVRLDKVVSRGKEYAQISVHDSGIGIDDKEKERIFSKFFRGSDAVKMATEGSGLGLFIVKNIIEAHKGKIWFESEKDIGTTFFVQIPFSLE